MQTQLDKYLQLLSDTESNQLLWKYIHFRKDFQKKAREVLRQMVMADRVSVMKGFLAEIRGGNIGNADDIKDDNDNTNNNRSDTPVAPVKRKADTEQNSLSPFKHTKEIKRSLVSSPRSPSPSPPPSPVRTQFPPTPPTSPRAPSPSPPSSPSLPTHVPSWSNVALPIIKAASTTATPATFPKKTKKHNVDKRGAPAIVVSTPSEPRPCFIETLPQEVMVIVFSFLNVQSLRRCVCVCKRWQNIAGSPAAWQNCFYEFPQTKAQLTSRDLQFERLSITQQTHFKALLLDGSSTLVYLSLVHVTSPSKQDLSGRNWGELFPNLRHVKFGYKDDPVPFLPLLPSTLVSLECPLPNWPDDSDASFRFSTFNHLMRSAAKEYSTFIERSTNLESLLVNMEVTSDTASALVASRFTGKLRRLRLAIPNLITASEQDRVALASKETFPHLVDLELIVHMYFTTYMRQFVCFGDNLKRLVYTHRFHPKGLDAINNAFLTAIREHNSFLEYLEISSPIIVGFTQIGIRELLTTCRYLHTLKISCLGSSHDVKFLRNVFSRALEQARSLKSLELSWKTSYVSLEESVFTALSGPAAARLESLVLTNSEPTKPSLTDNCIKILSRNCSRLKVLHLFGAAALSNQCLPFLEDMKDLHDLHLDGCVDAEVLQFQRALWMRSHLI